MYIYCVFWKMGRWATSVKKMSQKRWKYYAPYLSSLDAQKSVRYICIPLCMYKSQSEYVSTAWFYTCINFFSALFLIRDDSFLNEIPESEASYFLKKSTASEKLKLFEDKISKKIPVRKSINTSLCLTSLWHRPKYVNLHFWMKELFLLLISAFTGYLNCNHSTKF